MAKHSSPGLTLAGRLLALLMALATLVAVPVAASAQYADDTTRDAGSSDVGGVSTERTGEVGSSGGAVLSDGAIAPQVLGRETTRGLALTGGDVLGLTFIGAGIVALGSLAVVSSRRRARATA